MSQWLWTQTSNLRFFRMFSNYTWNFVNVVNEGHTWRSDCFTQLVNSKIVVASDQSQLQITHSIELGGDARASLVAQMSITATWPSACSFFAMRSWTLRRTPRPSRSTEGRMGFGFIIGNFTNTHTHTHTHIFIRRKLLKVRKESPFHHV